MDPERSDSRNDLGGISSKRQAENVALDFLLDWGRQLPELIEERDRRREKLKALLKEVEAYWNGIAPYGAGFTAESGIGLLLHDAKRFAEGLVRVVQKADDQKALMDHKATSGQEVTEGDRQRWFAYLDAAHSAQEALSPAAPAERSENSGPGGQ